MRDVVVMLAFAALVVGMEPREESVGIRLAQTGPVPTSVVNPRLGAPPPGGHLGETIPGAVVPRTGGALDSRARAGAAADRVGTPPAATVPNAATGAVPPPAMAVPDTPTQAVPPPAAGAVPPAGR